MSTTRSFYDLPETITHNKKLYTRVKSDFDHDMSTQEKVKILESEGKLVLVAKVLPRNLRGKQNLHNKPYRPSEFLFTHLKQK